VPVPSLTAEQLRQKESEAVREQLRAALANRNWSEIDLISKQILQKEPADGEAWHAQGWVFEKDRSYAEAADAYGKAIKGGFLPPSCLIKRAAMNRRLGKSADAIADLEESIRLDREPIVTPNLLMVAQIEAGNADAVRNSIAAFEKVGIVANADRFLLGKAALEIHDGNFPKAANSLAALQSVVSRPLFAVLVQDSFFDPYRTNPDLGPYLIVP
jgi:tetratricopeptide (TPR) repeat protein